MSFNFPSSPADGTTFAPAGGPTYVFSSGVWKLAGSGTAFTVVSDTPPASPFPGMLWWESDTGALFFWYVDANSSQWVQVNFTPSSGQTAEARNRIVNGAMQISQENADNFGGNNFFIADQWSGILVGFTTNFRRLAELSPNGSQRILHTITTVAKASPAATDIWLFRQCLEGIRMSEWGWGAPGAKPVVLRFWAYGPTGTYCVAIKNGDTSRTYLASFNLTPSWQQFTIPIPGDTTGTWAVDNGIGLMLNFCWATGSNYIGVAGWQAGSMNQISGNTNGAAIANNVFKIADVGLHLDPLATGLAPPWQMPDEAQELAACQRYWQQVATLFEGNVTSAVAYNSTGFLIVTPRGTPAITGVTIGQSSFPATVGSLSLPSGLNWVTEARTASATANRGYFRTTATVNARL